MKNNVTIAISIPAKLLQDIDNESKEQHIPRSTLITGMLSVVMQWKEEERKSLKLKLNSLYGRQGV